METRCKVIVQFLGLLALGSVLVGCGANPDANYRPIRREIENPFDGHQLVSRVARYEVEYATPLIPWVAQPPRKPCRHSRILLGNSAEELQYLLRREESVDSYFVLQQFFNRVLDPESNVAIPCVVRRVKHYFGIFGDAFEFSLKGDRNPLLLLASPVWTARLKHTAAIADFFPPVVEKFGAIAVDMGQLPDADQFAMPYPKADARFVPIFQLQ